jgi:putative membrane protein
MTVPLLPTINASLNFLAGAFLFAGWLAIKRGDRKLHQKLMICALISSAVFLACYVTYHAMMHGHVTRYQGTGMMRFIYFSILLTHTPLAMIIVPFSIMAVRHAIRGEFEKHTKITRWLMPVWMYVSVTGVLIYVILYLL